MNRTDEKGMALILVMIMVAVLSVIAASLMAVSTADTASSTNYRLMTLARYGAETAVHRASNYLMSNAYAAAGPSTGADPLTNYDMTGTGTPDPVTNLSVVTYGGAPVRLSHSTTSFNYPGGFGGSVGTAFRNASNGTLAGTYAVTYRAVATLVSMRQISVFGGGSAIVQTWKITGEGLMPVTGAAVDVSAILERQVAPVFSYAAFATDPGCAALDWQGNAYTDSYDSTVGHTPDVPQFGGNVGTNGNLTLTGTAEINGTLSTPRSGVGSCAAGNALTGSLTKVDGMVSLPQPVTYPTPAPPANLSAATVPNTGTQVLSPRPAAYGDIGAGSGFKGLLQLPGGGAGNPPAIYDINSITLNGQGSIQVTGTGSVVLNVAGYGTAGVYEAVPSMLIPITLQGGSNLSVPDYDPSRLTITYAGTQSIALMGTTAIIGLVYAPNADIGNGGTPDLYGAVIGRKVHDFGNARIHYDRALSTKNMMLGNWMMDSFTWRKF
jgi:hypothetical protein